VEQEHTAGSAGHAETVPAQLAATTRAYGDRPALKYKVGGDWRPITWNEYRRDVLRAARGLVRLGVPAGAGVAIMGANRPEWFIADMAAIHAGALPAGIYSTSTPDQCHYVAHHCEAAVAIVESQGFLDLFLGIRDRLPHLRAIVLMDGAAEVDGVHTWEELLALGDETAESELEARMAAQQANDACTLIYTSGTTGAPKAVTLSHTNLLWTARRTKEAFEFTADDQLLSYLPLSHIAEQIVTLHGPMQVGACSWFAESLDKLGANLKEVQPTIFFAVPRVWEKMQAAIEAVGARNSPLKKKISRWARRKGLAAGYAEQRGERPPAFVGLAKKLVFSKVRVALGLDRAAICACSAAPISLDTLEFFLSLGIPILEVYGMSECTGPATFSTPDRYRTGRAGFAIPGGKLRIAEDGEVLMWGPNVFLGYYKNPEATAETVDSEGWIHSGDVGEIDDDGFLKITDRKKELIITSGGKNVAPAPIEAQLKTIPALALAAVLGDRKNYLAALVTLDPERLPSVAEEAGSPARTLEEAAACPILRAHFEKQIEEVNGGLARYEMIRRFEILPGQFTIEGGELTPTMKLKRRVIKEKYADAIERLYA
jgi:long-subunit acyl-CoA synthetase (AMP-forming)